MFNDILRANGGDCNRELVRTLCEKSATVVEWLSDFCNIDFELVTDFLYPGHSRHRMHSTQNRTGEQLIQKIVNKINSMGNIYLLSGRRVIDLIIDEHEVKGIKVLYGKDTEEIRAKKSYFGFRWLWCK
jgi:Aspartate oxidase